MPKSTEELLTEWNEVLESEGAPKLTDYNKKVTIATLLENQLEDMNSADAVLSPLAEGTDVSANPNRTGDQDYWDPILISLVRRAMPNLVAFDVAGVQAMTGPTQQIFALRSFYATERTATGAGPNKLGAVNDLAPNEVEALRQEADTAFSGEGTHSGDPASGTGTTVDYNINGEVVTVTDPLAEGEFGIGMETATAEDLGTDNNEFNEMKFKIEKSTVTARSRGLAAGYTIELAQDLKRIHGLSAGDELASILQTEILSEINREMIRTINRKAKLGALSTLVDTATDGVFDLAVDADGRYLLEKIRSLFLQIERECNFIAKDTRRGRGNWILCSSDVASALAALGVIDAPPTMNPDDTGNTFIGTVQGGRIKVYIDPYAMTNYVTVGYRGSSPYDAGIFYCPYIPLQQMKAIEEKTFQPRIGFKTRYGMVANPFAQGHSTMNPMGDDRQNKYFRIFRVDNINIRESELITG